MTYYVSSGMLNLTKLKLKLVSSVFLLGERWYKLDEQFEKFVARQRMWAIEYNIQSSACSTMWWVALYKTNSL